MSLLARMLGLFVLVIVGLATPLDAQERRTFTLPETAMDNLPPPRPPIDLRGANIFTLDGLFETIESISDAFNEDVHLDNIDAFVAMGVDPGVMPEMFREEMHVAVRVSGDWSFDHEGTARGLIIPFEDGSSLHRINIHLPGYAYPWVFATRLPDDDNGIIVHPLISQLASALGNPPDLRNAPLTAAFGAAAQHMFRPDRFDGRQMLGLDWSDVTADGLFDGPFTLVDQGTMRADTRDPRAIPFRLRAVINEYEGEAGTIAPQPTGRTGIVTVAFCPLVIWEGTPEFCDPPLGIEEVTPEPDRENVAREDIEMTVRFSEPVDLPSLEANFHFFTMDAQGRRELVLGEWEHLEQARYSFEPFEPLRSGTRYRLRIDGGEGTVLSKDQQAVLGRSWESDFSTWLDFDEQRPGSQPRDTATEQRFQDYAMSFAVPADIQPGAIALHHFQVVRDGPLTRRKPTVTRAYFDWTIHDDIDPDWQPESFRMEVELNQNAPRWQGQFGFGPRDKSLRIWRSHDATEFDEDHLRQARHTANFYGWQPRSDGAFDLSLKPHDPWPLDADPPLERASDDFSIWEEDPLPLQLNYTFAQVGSWVDGIPPNVSFLAGAIMQEVAREVPSFFPHRAARANFTPTIAPVTAEHAERFSYDPDGFSIPRDSVSEWFRDVAVEFNMCHFSEGQWPPASPPPPPVEAERDLVRRQAGLLRGYYNAYFNDPAAVAALHDVIQTAQTRSGAAGQNQVMILFVPPDLFAGRTAGYALGMSMYEQGHPNFGFDGMRVYISVLDPQTDFDTTVQVHLHEIGHEFGLPHMPGNAMPRGECPAPTADGTPRVAGHERQGRREDGLEGWRMAPGGMTGWNKSVTEGNAEVPDNTLVSMMWPFAMRTRYQGILHHEDERMRESISRGPAAVWQQGQHLVPLRAGRYAQADDRQTDAGITGEMLQLVGVVSQDGGGLIIHSIDRVPATNTEPAGGDFNAYLLDQNGEIQAQAPLRLLPPLPDRVVHGTDDPFGWARFIVTLPASHAADYTLEIREGDRLRARTPPEDAVTMPAIHKLEVSGTDGDGVMLRWLAEGARADQVSIGYSPDGDAPWTMVQGHVEENSAFLDLSVLPRGPAPALRVTARRGLVFVDAIAPIPDALQPRATVELASVAPESFDAGGAFTLYFDSPMQWSKLPEQIVLEDESGNAISAQTIIDPEMRSLTILPQSATDIEDLPLRLRFKQTLQNVYGQQVAVPSSGGPLLPAHE